MLPLAAGELQRYENKRILITGAGGYLGSALARALAELPISHLVLLDVAEYGLYRLEQDLRARKPEAVLNLVVGSVQDAALLKELFSQQAPEIIFHAAALKHVPLMEGNALAAAETNVLGTHALLTEATKWKMESFVLLSTDKAVAPISIMGATKRVAEQIVWSARKAQANCTALRLCNVLGSTGSVAPLFARQIARRGPVTVTDPEATRYFISRTDAVRHLLRSAIATTRTGLTIPLVGAPRRVEELATHMIQQARSATGAINIVHTGLRLSDKLHEQLISSSESTESLDDSSSTLAVHTSFDPVQLQQAVAEIAIAVRTRDRVRLTQAMQRAVPEYVPQGVLRQEMSKHL